MTRKSREENLKVNLFLAAFVTCSHFTMNSPVVTVMILYGNTIASKLEKNEQLVHILWWHNPSNLNNTQFIGRAP